MFYPYSLYWNSYYMIGTIFVVIAAVLAIFAQTKVQSTYKR